MLCRRGNPIINGATNAMLWLIQGMPTVLLLMILYYIIFGSTRLSGTLVAIVGFTLIFACAMYDMLAVGFGAIGNGQYEAATAMGYSNSQSFFKILLPQAARLSSMIAPVSTGMSFFMAMPPQSWMAAIQRSMVLSGVRRVVSSKCTSRPGFTSAPGHSAATSLSVRPSQPPFVAKG